MGMLGRMGRSITSTFDALLDKVDDPSRSIEQTIREMREQIRAARREVVSSVASERQLKARVEELDSQAERWGSRAELAVKSGDDDLARAALFQKRRVEGERRRAEELRGEQRANALEMKSELSRMERRVIEIESTKGTLATQVKQARAGGGVEALGGDGSAFSELRRLEAEIEGVEVAVEAQRELDEVLRPAGPGGMSASEVEARFRRLEAGEDAPSGAAPVSEVEDELKAIKQRFRV